MNEEEQFNMQIGQQETHTNTSYLAAQQITQDPLMSQHLDASKILFELKMRLEGKDFDDENEIWKPAVLLVGYDKDGNKVYEEEGPLMEPKQIRLIIGYLQSFLNPNTFLSKIKEETINDKMYDVCCNLGMLFHSLRHKLKPEEWIFIMGMIENPIHLGLSRADGKITLDAVSKTQHTIEHLKGGLPSPGSQQPTQKEFKMFGF